MTAAPTSAITSSRVTFNFTWTITNFTELCADHHDTIHLIENDEMFRAPIPGSKNQALLFTCSLYPRGSNEQNAAFVGAYLTLKSTLTKPLRILYTMSVLDVDGAKRNVLGLNHVFNRIDDYWGLSNFIRRADLFDPTKKLLPEDKLTLHFEINICQSVVNRPESSKTDQMLEKIEPLPAVFTKMLEDNDLTDVVLVLDDGQQFHAHKLVLAARSSVFRNMFKFDMKEKTEGKVVMEKMSADVCREMLRFIYSGKVQQMEKNAEELMVAGDKYQLDPLKPACEEWLCQHLTVESVPRLESIATICNATKLKTALKDFMRNRGHSLLEQLLGKPQLAVEATEILEKMLTKK